MSDGIPLPQRASKGRRQAHADLPKNNYERELGRDGFYGPVSHMLHRHPPTAWLEFEGELKPRAFDTCKLIELVDSPWQAQSMLLNDHCHIRIWKTAKSMDHLVRNADGDELLFIHEGSAELYCDYGHMSIGEGDYVVIPRGTLWRVETNAQLIVLMIEATAARYSLPDKGIVGQHAIFDPALLEVPELDKAFIAQQDENEWQVMVKRVDRFTRIVYPFNPLDAIDWQGSLMPVRINWRDIRPLMSHRYHLPPSAHTTFVAPRFVVCSFCPRPMESDPGALKVPFFHSNEDYDEVIFYHAGDFFSRDNIHPGMMSFHPAGFPHGPHPKALASGQKKTRKATDEVAVMIDTCDALELPSLPEGVECVDYVDSWRAKG